MFGSSFFYIHSCSSAAIQAPCILAVNLNGLHFLNKDTHVCQNPQKPADRQHFFLTICVHFFTYYWWTGKSGSPCWCLWAGVSEVYQFQVPKIEAVSHFKVYIFWSAWPSFLKDTGFEGCTHIWLPSNQMGRSSLRCFSWFLHHSLARPLVDPRSFGLILKYL